MAKSGVHEYTSPLQLKHIPSDDMSIIRTIGDGSCFFHSILRAYSKTYIETSDQKIRKQMARAFRDELAVKLESKVGNKTYYETLARGELKEFSKQYKKASLSSMVAELKSSSSVDHIYMEMISDLLNIDIFTIDVKRGDLYPVGSDTDILYKGRNAVFVAYVEGHYDCIGSFDKNGVCHTLFTDEHPFVMSVRNRMAHLVPDMSICKVGQKEKTD